LMVCFKTPRYTKFLNLMDMNMGLWQVGADGIKLNFGNTFVLLFQRTEIYWAFVSN
jgi:hypothetical protein